MSLDGFLVDNSSHHLFLFFLFQVETCTQLAYSELFSLSFSHLTS